MKKLTLLAALLLTTAIAGAQELCKSKTLKGEQCHHKAVERGYCKQHDPNAIRCAALTKAGKPCRNLPSKGQTHCHLHKG